MSNRNCPDKKELEAFNEGRISDSRITKISEHIAKCDDCLNLLEDLPAGTLAENLRVSIEQHGNEIQKAESESDLDFSGFAPTEYEKLGFDRYEILGMLGESKLAKCYLAGNEAGELFAIKIPFSDKLASQHHVKLFLNDASIVYGLSHPNIQKAADFGLWQHGVPFVAMPYIESPSLKTVAKNSRLADETVLKGIYLQICNAIQFAHERQVLHRHLTPNNIFLCDGQKILVNDFCIHYDGHYQFDLTEPNLDPNPFVSPEAANNNPDFVDVRSDVFSLGKILKLLVRLTDSLNEQKAGDLKRIHMSCTRPRRRDRFQTVNELIRDFKNCLR